MNSRDGLWEIRIEKKHDNLIDLLLVNIVSCSEFYDFFAYY